MSSSIPGGGSGAAPDKGWVKAFSDRPWGPLWPLLVLAAIPATVFGVPALAGRLLLFGDNLHQNYPLRVLVGADIKHGYMPLWDPYLWSGSPLLAGFNAGAAYPTTGLFAVFSPFVAWTLGEIAIYMGLGIGCYLLFRSSAIRAVPALVAAASFSFAGAAAAQVVHVDMAEGLASLPWMLLSVRRVVQGRGLFWVLLLSFTASLVVLAGAPEAMLDEAVVVGLFGILQAGGDRKKWTRLIGWGLFAFVLVLGISAVQWLPGLGFVRHSQRAAANYVFFSSGSLPPVAGLLAVVPYFLGGYGQLGQPGYFGPYNLPEVSTYIGILGVVAAIAVGSPHWRHRLPPLERRTWFGIGLVSLALSLGGYTPLGHVLSHIPLYGSQRLQSRNVFGIDLAASALLGWWLDGGIGGEKLERLWFGDKLAAAVPLAAASVVAVWMVIHPTGLVEAAQGYPPGSSALRMAGVTVGFSFVLCVLAAVLVWKRPKLEPSRWMRFALIFVVVDLGVYSALGQMPAAPTPSQVTAHTPVVNAIAAHLSSAGRYAVFDPQLYDYGGLLDAGDPDMGIVRGLSSVQGYGSILDATYEASTATHAQAGLSPAALANNTLDPLNLQVLASMSEYFIQPISGPPNDLGKFSQIQVGPKATRPFRWGNKYSSDIPGPLPMANRPPLDPYGSEGWYFGTALHADFVDVILSTASRGQRIQIATMSPSGTTTWRPPQVVPTGSFVAKLDTSGRIAIGAKVRNLSHAPLFISALSVGDLSSKQIFVTTGTLASSIRPSAWSWAGKQGSWSLFVRNRQPTEAWASPAVNTSGSARIHVLSQKPDGTETIAVSSPFAFRLNRSLAYLPGWHASMNSANGLTKLQVRRANLVQQVEVPAGSHTITFYYHPSKVFEGLTITLITTAIFSLLALAVLLNAWIAATRRSASKSHPIEQVRSDYL